jgi:predicted enzyme related to lactoylglutathione lyase
MEKAGIEPGRAPRDNLMAEISLTLLVLKTRQVERLRSFYKALGIELAEEQHGIGPIHYAGRVGELVLELYPLPDDGGGVDTTTRLGFSVENLPGTIEATQAAGAPAISQPQDTPWGLRAVVRDPDGRAIELYQRGRKADPSHPDSDYG